MPRIASRKIAFISDIHANHPALKAVLAHPNFQEAGTRICLGDVVGYGAKPNECVDLVRSQQFICLAGNHDKVALDPSLALGFNPAATLAINWTAEKLSTESKSFLAGLPSYLYFELVNGTAMELAHGSLLNHTEEYLVEFSEAERNFNNMIDKYCFVGHTHKPKIFAITSQEALCLLYLEKQNDLSDLAKCIINPGSVGQPRDYDWRASFTIFDQIDQTIEVVRVDYDIAAAQQAITAASLPPRLASRLAEGR